MTQFFKEWQGRREAAVGAVFSIIGGLFLLHRIPYGFETNDQFQYFILPYRSIYQAFLVGDWFTWQTSHYHVTFSLFIRALHAMFGEAGFPYAVFGMHLLVLFGLAYALWRMAKAMDAGVISAVIALLVVGFIRRMGAAETTVNHGVLLPADMALPFFLLSLAYWIERKPLPSGLFLGLAGLIHANYAVLGPMVIAVPELYYLIKTKDVSSTVTIVVAYFGAALPTLLCTVTAFFSGDSAPEALHILFNVRSPHHYSPVLAGSKDLVFLGTLVLAGSAHFMVRCKSGYRHRAIFLALIGTQLLAMAATAVQQPLLVRLFFWRLSLALMLMSAVSMGAIIETAFQKKDWARALFGISAFLIVISFSTGGRFTWTPKWVISGNGWMVAAMVVSLLYLPLNRIKNAKIRAFRYVFGTFPLAFGLILSSGVDFVAAKDAIRWDRAAAKWGKFADVTAKEIRGDKPPRPIHAWIEKHVPKDAAFLIPPGTNGFRFEARRAAFVDWKCCPMKGEEIKEWQRRMLAVVGRTKFPAKGYALHRVSNKLYQGRSLTLLSNLAKKEGLTHILTKKETGYKAAGLKKLIRKSGWSVFEVL